MKHEPAAHQPALVAVCAAFILLLMQGTQSVWADLVEVDLEVGSTSPGDFTTLTTFPPPSGFTTADTWTVARILTNNDDVTGLSLRIEPPTDWTPANIVVEGATDTISDDLGRDVASVVYALVADSPAVADGHKVIEIVIEYVEAYNFGTTPQGWLLKVEQLSADHRYTGFIETGAGDLTSISALVQLPKMEVLTPEIAFAEVHLNVANDVAPVQPVPVRNVGTADLNITGPSIYDTDEASFGVEVAITPPIPPGGEMDNVFDEDPVGGTEKKGLWIDCQPADFGPKTATLTVESDGGDSDVDLSATGVALYSTFLLDVSESMGWNSDGSQWVDVPETQTRLWKAKQAAKQVTSLINIFSGGDAYVGLSTFPHPTGLGNSYVAVSVNEVEFNAGSIYGKLADVGDAEALTARNGTPMSDGFHAAVGDMEDRLGPLGLDVDRLRQAILLLSDGAAGEPSDEPPYTPEEWIPVLADDLQIRVYAIGYGDEDGVDVDWPLLKGLGVDTGGAFLPAGTDTIELAKAFKEAAREWLGLRPTYDPEGLIGAGETLEFTVSLDDSTYGATFVVDWEHAVDQGIELELKPPKGPWITPDSAGVTYEEGKTYAMYVIQGGRIRGGQGAGEWTMRLSASDALPSEPMAYAYSVYSQSPLSLEPAMSQKHMVTGQAPLLTASLRHLPARARRHTTVSVDIDYPAASLRTHIAANDLDPALLVRRAGQPSATAPEGFIPETLLGEPATLVQRKLYALALAGNAFDDERTKQQVRLYDDGTHGDEVAGDGVFSARLPPPAHDGLHRFHLRSITEPPGQAPILREAPLNSYVSVGLSGKLLKRQTRWRSVDVTPYFGAELERLLASTPAKGYARRSVVVSPRDENGNYLGPGAARDVVFTLSEAEPVGPPIDNLDGSYVQVVEFRKNVKPRVEVAAGEVISSPVRLGGSGWQLSAHLGSSWPSGDAGESLDNDFSASLAAGYRFTERWSLDLIAGRHNFSEAGEGDPSLFQLSFNGKYTWPMRRSEIFVRGGPGLYDPRPGDSELGWNVGVGWSYPYRVGWDLELMVDHHQLSEGGDTEFQTAQIGFRVTFS